MHKVNDNHLHQTMSQCFELGVIDGYLWRRECLAKLVQLGAVNGDVMHGTTKNQHDVVAILDNNVLKRMGANNNRVYIVREFTDRYRNALTHFADVVKLLFDIDFEVLIEIHPSDEGLGDYVDPVDLRMYSYSLLYTAYGKFVLYSPVRCGKQPRNSDDDKCCTTCGIIEGCFATETSDDTDFYLPPPEHVGRCVASHVKQSQITMTDIIFAFKRNVTKRSCIRARSQRFIVGHDGKMFTLEKNQYFMRRHIEMREVESYSKLIHANAGDGGVVFQVIAGPNRLYLNTRLRTRTPTLRCCVDMVPSYTIERIYDFTIAAAILDLPIYVILWIIDCLPGTQYVAHVTKLRYVEAIQKSIRKVREARLLKIKHAK